MVHRPTVSKAKARGNYKPKLWICCTLLIIFFWSTSRSSNNTKSSVHTYEPISVSVTQSKIEETPFIPKTQTPSTNSEFSIFDLPVASPPPAEGGIIIYHHIVKTGGTTIRDNFKNKTVFPQLDYYEVFVNSQFMKVVPIIEKRISQAPLAGRKTIMIELHGRNTPTLPELAPQIQAWKQSSQVPIYAFTMLRDPVQLAISFFNHFHVFGDKRFGPNMPGTVDNLRKHLYRNPQCLYLFRGEQAYFAHRKFYNVTEQDCERVHQLLDQVMDWVGDTKDMSKDTLPLLTYWVTGNASLANSLGSSNVAGVRWQKYDPLPKRDVDEETIQMIRARSELDQRLYQDAIRNNQQLKELVSKQ